MKKTDPWEGYDFGRMDCEIYQAMGFSGITVSFKLEIGNLYLYCKKNSLKINPTLMKICFYLSEKYIPKLTLGLNHRIYDAGFSLGFVKAINKTSHFVEPIVLERMEDGNLREIRLREYVPEWQKILMKYFPRFATMIGKHLIPATAVKNYPSFQISRGFLPSVGERITSTIMTTPRSQGISIPFGDSVHATFLAPHAFANLNYYDSFLKEFIFMIENPEQIPSEILSVEYKELG